MNISDGHDRKGKVRVKKANLRVDLTPLVDLAFLLIAFFMLTTTLLERRAMELIEPKDSGPQTPVSVCQVLNLVTDSLGQVYYWEGLDCRAVTPISLSGDHALKQKIKDKKNYLTTNCLYPSGKSKDLICLIKLLPGSHYEHMVRVLDEVVADSIPVYAIQRYTDEEVRAVKAVSSRN